MTYPITRKELREMEQRRSIDDLLRLLPLVNELLDAAGAPSLEDELDVERQAAPAADAEASRPARKHARAKSADPA